MDTQAIERVNKLSKEDILSEIEIVLVDLKADKKRNSMGCLERYYNPYYLIGSCFSTEMLMKVSEEELRNLLLLAEFTSEVFY